MSFILYNTAMRVTENPYMDCDYIIGPPTEATQIHNERSLYVNGHIEVDEFERRVGEILAASNG